MLKIVFTLLLLIFSVSGVAEVKTINGKKEAAIPPATLNIIYPKTMPSLIEENYYPLLVLKTAFISSLVVVFPLEPVIPITAILNCARWCAASF